MTTPKKVRGLRLYPTYNKIGYCNGELKEHDIMLSIAEFVTDEICHGFNRTLSATKFARLLLQPDQRRPSELFLLRFQILVWVWLFIIFLEKKDDVPQELRYKRSIAAGFNYIFRRPYPLSGGCFFGVLVHGGI